MVINELIKRSPIRIFEQSIDGGLKPGEIGIIASVAGVGKTSVLVQLALDKLLQGKRVIHVSFTQQKHYVPLWYEVFFSEFINKKNIAIPVEVKNDLAKNRVLMNFNQDGVTKEQIIKSLRAMIKDGGFNADLIIIDGFDFSRSSDIHSCLASVKAFASELGLNVWYSCSIKDNNKIDSEIPGFAEQFDVVVNLQPKTDHVELSIFRDRNTVVTKPIAMKLDPKTLLILEV